MKIITTHKNTDFDALASVIAGTLLYPGAKGVIPKMVNKNVAQFLSTHSKKCIRSSALSECFLTFNLFHAVHLQTINLSI